MFNNLIESTSHAQEFKRRGSFLLFTTATYLVLFVITGVISIYAYDAHLETQNTELEITFIPVPPPEAVPPDVIRNTIRPASTSATTPGRSTRTDLIDSTSNPNNVPDHPGITAQSVPPARPDSVIGAENVDPPTPLSSGHGIPGGTGNTPLVDILDNPPPPAPNPTPSVPKVIKISRVLNSQALALPRPNYPPIAKQTRTQGTVTVQVLIDETGKVISAKAVSGHPFLIPEAQRAAMQARFSPTIIGEQPVKVSGVITYNFIIP
jgi:periplasmic protein TonB